jgi:hypothetical protein
MKLSKIAELIESTQPNPEKKGKLFRVEFIKRDNTHRVIRGRLGMKHGLTYTGQSYNPGDYGMKTVWSTQDKGYRNIRLDSIVSLMLPDRNGKLQEVMK